MSCKCLVSLATVSLVSASALAGEKRIHESQVPPQVLTVFHKTYPVATIRGLVRETKHKRTIYEVESLDAGTLRDISYLLDGTVIEIEETLSKGDVPSFVMDSAKVAHPSFRFLGAEKTIRGETITYELHIKEGGRFHEVIEDEKGKILN